MVFTNRRTTPFLSSKRLAMVDIAALPRETLSMIFQYLEPFVRSSSKRDLLHCIQVCRLWHDLAVPLLYRQIWVYIASPPAEEDIIRKLFSNPRTSQIRHLHILITSGGHVYDVQQQCDEIIEDFNETSSMVEAATNLRLVDLDLCAFTPPDSVPNLQPSLQAANNLLVSLTGTITVWAFSTRRHSPRRRVINRSSNLQP